MKTRVYSLLQKLQEVNEEHGFHIYYFILIHRSTKKIIRVNDKLKSMHKQNSILGSIVFGRWLISKVKKLLLINSRRIEVLPLVQFTK